MQTVHINTSTPYDVFIGPSLLDKTGELLVRNLVKPTKDKPCKAAIIADDNVDERFGDRMEISLKYKGFDVIRTTFPAGEASKNLETLSEILEFLAENRMTRSDIIVALGGGVTGDMAGFAAAVYARGIRYIQVPTTLLAMVDSSVGGKTAVDLKAGKNLAGAFHQPSMVIADTWTLGTLPPREIASGSAEIIKYGVLYDNELLEDLSYGLWLRNADIVESVIERCVRYKRDVVAEDEFDTGNRAFLNLGHTFGHAIEKCSNYSVSHGQAVAIGTIMAALVADMDEMEVRRVGSCMVNNGLTTRCMYSADQLAEAALGDKKRSGDTITLVLPRAVEDCYLKKIHVSELKGYFERAIERHESMRRGL